jgi:hypothetical protein
LFLLFLGSIRALLGLGRLKVPVALRQSMQTYVVRRLPECRRYFEHFDGRFEAFENCIAFFFLCSGSASLLGRLRVSAALRESMQTYAMRRFPERGRGFAHATVAGLVSRSRFLSFGYFMGDFELRCHFDSSLSGAPCRYPPPTTARQCLFPYFAHATVAGLHKSSRGTKVLRFAMAKTRKLSLFLPPYVSFFF